MIKRGSTFGFSFLLFLLLAIIISACTPGGTPTGVPAVTATKPPAATAAVPTQPSKATQAEPKPSTTPPAPAAKLFTVRAGGTASTADAGLVVGVEKGYFREQGLDVQVMPFQSGAMMIAPLSAGELEVAGGTISTGLLNAIERGLNLKIVAAKGAVAKGFVTGWVTVRKDLFDSGEVRQVKDLKGRKFAVTSLQSGNEAIAGYLLKQGGLTTKDVEFVPLSFADMVLAYGNKSIDVAVQTEPQLSAAVEKGLAVRWPPGDITTLYGGEYQTSVLVYSEAFSKNIDMARRFMVGYVKAVRDYNDAIVKGKDRDAIYNILAKNTPHKDPALLSATGFSYLNPDGRVHVPSIKMDFEYLKQMGYYTGKLELEPLLDGQFVEYAIQQLGTYK